MPSRSPEEIQIADQAAAGDDSARSPAGDDSQAREEQTLDKNFALRREVDRLDELLSEDGNWRALAQLDEREIRGQPLERDLAERLRSGLTEALASNRIYLARKKISEALAILDGGAILDEEAIQDGSAVLKGSVSQGGTAKTDDKVEKREVVPDATRQFQNQQAEEANRSPFRTQINVKSRNGTQGGEKEATSTSEPFVPKLEQSTPPAQADAPITTVSNVNGALDTGGIAAALVGVVALPVGFSVASSLKSDEPEQPNTSPTDVSSHPSPQETSHQLKQTSPDKLELIKGIDEQLGAGLNGAGVSRYEQIAQWTSADISSISMQLDLHGRIASNNWIEQAAILATGETTNYARQASSGVRATLVPAPQPPSDVVGRKLFPRMAPVAETKARRSLSVEAQPRAVELSTKKPSAVNPKPVKTQMLTPQIAALLAVKTPVVHPGEGGSDETDTIQSAQSAVPATSLTAALKSSAADEAARAPTEQPQSADKAGGHDGAASASAFPKSDYTGDFLNRPFVANPAAPSELQPIATATQEKQQLAARADDELASDTSDTAPASPVSASPVLTSTESLDRLPVSVDVPPASPGDTDHAAGQDEASLSEGATRSLAPLLETLAVKSSAFDAPRRRGACPILAPVKPDPASDQRSPVRQSHSARVLEETGKANGLADNALKVDRDVANAGGEAMMLDGEGTNVDDEDMNVDGEAVVMIIPRDSSESPAVMADTLLDTDRPRPALGRVKRDKEQRENPIESHAAYRMDADEASVTIVHHDGREEAPDLPFYKQNEHWDREGTIRKFLKALTGD